MQEFMLKAKLHRATITHAELSYEGSLSIDQELMAAVGLREFERIHIYNINNGERFETYAIKAPGGSGTVGLNGAAARKGMVGDLIIIVSYCLVDAADLANYRPQIALLGSNNRIKEMIAG
ncbi:aspartate 1-decarboxylase [Desulfofustis glycolicus]|uniref:Aspartate 1-decarboxylase n=1 Tax=Desulfofustis glycolicus DSM 9705 TaxID=1121409 RepID=A0A1M5WX07_9BACT|nr:aspartate 1-decarboxylase [Desulfobulbaceae bacterium]SHH92129.1 L-aspartate 1-decarboxylase [Desulfofustis glycolicus DSM 9705]